MNTKLSAIFGLALFSTAALAGSTGFEALDSDTDGYVSKTEALGDKDLSSNWDKVDANQDGMIDSSEYSVFAGEEHADEAAPEEISE